MISSKRITWIGIFLVAAALALTVLVMLLPNEAVFGNFTGTVAYSEQHQVTYTEDDYFSAYSENTIAKINLLGSTASSESPNVRVEEKAVTILGGGTYVLSGELTDGSLIVDAPDGGEVRLVMNGAKITSSDFSALYVKEAKKVVLSLVEGTENILSDGSAYREEKLEDGKPSAALYAKDDLTINGKGTLIINGNYEDGLKVNDTLKVTEGILKVTAKDDGINANDVIAFLAAALEVTSGGDALKCENESEEKGFIAFGGTGLTIVSEGDGISASSAVYANEVTASITAAGGSQSLETAAGGFGGFGRERQEASETDTPSTKAVKAGTDLVINGGSYNLNSPDDALHSDGDMTIEGGDFTLATDNDAIHAEKNVKLSPKTMEITTCLEGLEGGNIVIDGGDIRIIARDDAINAVGENGGGGFGRGPMGMRNEEITEEDIYLTINGGNLYIETAGDGVDSNGAALVNGGYLEVYGPENDGNSSLDFEYGFILNGGRLLAAGSAGMAELPSEASEQPSLVFYLEESHEAKSKISVTDGEGNEIMAGEAGKKFNWVLVSAPEIEIGKEYTLSVNGSVIAAAEAAETVTSSGNQERTAPGMPGGEGQMGGDGTTPPEIPGGEGQMNGEERTPPEMPTDGEGMEPPERPGGAGRTGGGRPTEDGTAPPERPSGGEERTPPEGTNGAGM